MVKTLLRPRKVLGSSPTAGLILLPLSVCSALRSAALFSYSFFKSQVNQGGCPATAAVGKEKEARTLRWKTSDCNASTLVKGGEATETRTPKAVSGRRHDVCDGPRDLHVDRMATSLPLRHACMRNGALCRARLPG